MANFTSPIQWNTPGTYYGGYETANGAQDQQYTPQWLIDLAQKQGQTLTKSPGIYGGNVGWKLGDYVYSGTAREGGEGGMELGNQFYRYQDSPLLRQAIASENGSILNGSPYEMVDGSGNVVGSGNWENISAGNDALLADAIVTALVGGVFGGVATGALSSGAAGGAAASTGGGGAAAGGAGVTGFGDAGAMYAGATAADAATLGGGASVMGGSALGSTAVGGAAAGVGGIGGAGGSGGVGGSGAMGAGGAAGGGATTTGGGLSSIGSAISNIFGGGGGMSWTDWIGPALQLVGGAYASSQAGDAADTQAGAAQAGIDEVRRQFDTVRQLLNPYVQAGNGALGSYQALSGAGGADAQAREIEALKGSPQFGALTKAGEDAILQNASATGGLRGGNTQGALANQRTQILSGLIDQQLGRYGSLIGVGQNSAAGTGSAAMNTGQQVSGLMQQQGAALAGGTLAGSRYMTDALGGIGGFAAARGWQPSTSVPASSGYGGAGASGGGGFGTGTVYGNQDYGQYF